MHLELRLYDTEVGLLSLDVYPGLEERSTSEQLLEHTPQRQASVYRVSPAPSLGLQSSSVAHSALQALDVTVLACRALVS